MHKTLTLTSPSFLGRNFSLEYAPAALLDADFGPVSIQQGCGSVRLVGRNQHPARLRHNIVLSPCGCTIASKMRFEWKFCGTLCQPPGWLGLNEHLQKCNVVSGIHFSFDINRAKRTALHQKFPQSRNKPRFSADISVAAAVSANESSAVLL